MNDRFSNNGFKYFARNTEKRYGGIMISVSSSFVKTGLTLAFHNVSVGVLMGFSYKKKYGRWDKKSDLDNEVTVACVAGVSTTSFPGSLILPPP